MTLKTEYFPTHRSLYYGGGWHDPVEGGAFETRSPATGDLLGAAPIATSVDIDRAVQAAREGFKTWSAIAPLERAKIMVHCAGIFRKHKEELAYLDAIGGGNPITEMGGDIDVAARGWEFFAGLVTEVKGSTVPMGPNSINYSVREPWGVVLRVAPFNHPFLFSAGRLAAPLATGNAVIVKPPEQSPMSALRMAELLHGELPPGVVNVLPGLGQTGAEIVRHPGVDMIAFTGSVPTGRMVMKDAAALMKPLILELGGKNALIAFPDADPDKVAAAMVRGMNFTWCGQSCGSTSRAFVHRDIHDAVVERIAHHAAAYRPGLPMDPATTMGSIVSEKQYKQIVAHIEAGKAAGAKVLIGGKAPDDAALANGYFIEPTFFTGVTQDMSIAKEEIFGPVCSVFQWDDEAKLIADVNAVEYGLTCSIWTNDITRAHRTAAQVEVGFVWINEVGKHFLGTPYGGYKQSGLGREESSEEAFLYTQQKHVHVNLAG